MPSRSAIFAMNVLYAIYSYAILRRAAEESREESIRQLSVRAMKLSDNQLDKERRRRISETIEEIKGIRQGAFATVSQQPIVGVVLLPLSGLGAWAMAQYFISLY